MDTSKRGDVRQLERANALRDLSRARVRLPLWLVPRGTPRPYRVWQRAVSALVAATLFTGPITITVEQGDDAAAVLAEGSVRPEAPAWQTALDLAALRVRFSMQLAQATPIVDPTAPIAFQPKITQSTGSGGGVPVVNITAPNAAGISLNQYQSFNIDPVGLILNNSLMSGTSLTGGNVAANPNLNGRTASIIVNQVTSSGAAYASLLNGPLEVFGSPATVIIANPNGITTQGTGFTNTIGVTLSTGVPQFLDSVGGTQTSFSNASAVGYSVTGGHIQIEGDSGVNGPGAGIEGTVGTIDLIGETIGVDAPLYAGSRINAVAGDQFVMPSVVDSTGTTWATSANGAANTAAVINAANGHANNGLAVDATAYGAMTAGQIEVIGTAAGMGVRADAQLAANTGDLTLSANGDVTVAGTAAQQQASIQSSGDVSMTGTHIGVGGYAINAAGDVSSTGAIQSGAALSINAGGDINVANTQSATDTSMTAGGSLTAGSMQSGGGLTLTAQGNDGTGDITLNGTSVVTGAAMLQAAQDIDVNGQTSSGSLQASAGQNLNVNAALQTSGDLALAATAGNLAANANVNSAGNLALSSGQAMTVAAQATADDAVTLAAGQGISVTGSLASGTTLTANTPGAFSVAGSLLVGTDATINGGSVDVPGVLIVQQNGTLNAQGDITGSGSLAFGENGTLASGQDVALTGKLLSNGLQVNAANSVTLGDVQAGGAFSVAASGASGNGDVTFNGNAAAVGATTVQAAGDVVVNGTLAGGAQVALGAQGNVSVASSATVQSVGDLSLSAGSGITSNGSLDSGGNLVAQAGQDIALNGLTTVTGNGTLTAGGDITFAGNSSFTGDATASAGNDIAVPGTLDGNTVTLNAGNSASLNNVQANGALAVTANGQAGGGDIAVNGTVTSQTGSTLNAAGSVSVASTASLGTAAALNVTAVSGTSIAGTVQSNGSMSLADTAGSLTSTGTIESGTDLAINAAQSIDLGSNSTSALGDLTLTAGQDITANGTVVAQGNGTLNAGGAITGGAAFAFGLAASLSSGGDTDLTGSLRGETVQTAAGGDGTFQDVQAGSTIALGATGNLTLNGTLAGGSTVALTAGQNIGVNGILQSTGDTTLNALAGTASVAGSLNSAGALAAQAGTDIDIGGAASVALDTTLQAGGDVNVTGSINGQGNGTVTAAGDIGGAGTLAFAQAATLTAGGSIAQGGLIQGQSVQVSAAGDAAVNNVESASTLALDAGTGGSGSLSVNGAAAAAGAVTAAANGDVTVASAGKLAAGTTVGVTALDDIDVAGAIESNGNAVLDAQQGSLNATGGINSGGTLDITTGLDLLLGASTSAVGDVTLDAGRDAVLNGTLVGQANGYVNAGRDIDGPGTQSFTDAAVYDAQRDIALTGSLGANSVQATGGDNAALDNVASATTLTLAANGNLGDGDASITGTATAPGTVTLNAARDVLISGSLGSGDVMTLAAQRNVTVAPTGTVESVGDLDVTATTGSATLGGTTTTSGALNVSSGLDTTLGGQVSAAGNVTVQAGRDIDLTGAVAGQMAGTLTAGQDITGAGSAAFSQAATLDAANDLSLTGSLQGSSVQVTGGNNAGLGSVQAVSGDLVVNANGNAGEGDVTFTGTATASGNVTLTAARDVSAAGTISSGGTTVVTAAADMALADVNSTGDLTLNAGGSLSTGDVTTNGNLVATAGNDLSMNSALASGTLALTAQGLDGTGDVTVAGALGAGGAMTVTAARDIAVGGDVTSGAALGMGAVRNLSVSGSIDSGGDTTLSAQNGNLAVAGTTESVGNLAASAGGSLALGGGLVNGSTVLNAGGDMALTGSLAGLDAAAITAGGSISGGGALTFGQNISLSAGGGITLGGIEGAGQLTATSAGDMSLGATTVVGALSATSTAGSIAFGGDVTSGGNVQITAAQGASVAGSVSSMGDVNIQGTGGNVSVSGGVSSNGDTTLAAGQTLTLGGTSTVAGELSLTGDNVTISGEQGTSENLTVSAQGTLDASQAALVSSQNMTLGGANVVLGTAIVGGNLTAQASNSLSVAAGDVDVVGTTSLEAQNSFDNAGDILSGGNLLVSAASVTDEAGASLASTNTTTVDATNFTNAGLVNGITTTLNVAGALDNSDGSLMGVNGLTINTGSLDNQNGLIFAGNTTGSASTTSNIALTISGSGDAFNNAGGQLLAQGNLAIDAPNATLDMSQGTISQAGQLALTVGTLDIAGTWDFGGTGVTVDALDGMVNNGTIDGSAPLTISTGGTFTNNGQVIGDGVTFNGTLDNAAGALLHASDDLAINGNVTNAGTVEAGGTLNVTGSAYDNQMGTTQAVGDISFNLGSGTLQNTGGSIYAGNDITINAGTVINDQAAPTGSVTTTQAISDTSVLMSGSVGTAAYAFVWDAYAGGDTDSGGTVTETMAATLGDLLSPSGAATDTALSDYAAYGYGECEAFCEVTGEQPDVNSGTVTFNEQQLVTGSQPETGAPYYNTFWFVGSGQGTNVTLTLPTEYETTTTEQLGPSGVISAGGSISLTANTLSNQSGEIAAQGNVSLNVQSLSNGALPAAEASQSTIFVNQAAYTAFLDQLAALGTIAVPVGNSQEELETPTEFTIDTSATAPTAAGTTVATLPTGLVVAGDNLTVSGGNLVNAGLLYAGNDVNITAASLTNEGGNQQNSSSQVGCASGVPEADCGYAVGQPRGDNPVTSSFSYSQDDATIYAGNDLVIAAGQINNTYGNLLAGYDIVIGGVGTTATSTTPAQSLNNTSGNIVAGNDITLNVSGSITNDLPPPVLVHDNYGTQQQYSGCMTAGGYKESYCEAYVDQQSGSQSVISAGNNLQINAGSLTNIGSLISAGTSATINVAGPVVNEAQTLNAYWHSEWVQETGLFSSDIRHNTWACGSVAECTALYGSAYTSVGGEIDPPTPVGNVAATIEAPNLSITSGGEIQNVGNVVGTSVSLTGQKLINGITTANTYTPTVNAPSQVISLSPLTMPNLNLSTPRTVGTPLPTPVAGEASYVDGTLGASQASMLGPQQLLNALPASLQPSTTLFYYNPQEEDLLLQQSALQQTGEASFINGLSYDGTTGMSVTDQEKAILYENAINYAEQNNLQLGTALTQTQINALTEPMLWYVEQTIPDPTCTATGVGVCPTITALMPQVYLPQNWNALSAGGNIEASQNLTLNFGSASTGGSITNTGTISSGGTLTVNTGTLTNEANQVNVGQIWNSVTGGYTDTTGTEVQPGGFMSAADMNLNVQTLNQIGGALQELNADGTVNEAGTQQVLAALQQQLGGDFTQTSVSNNLNTSFTAQGGGLPGFVALAIAIVASILTYGAASAAIGATLGAEATTFAAATATATAGLGNIALAAGMAGLASSVTSQVLTTGSVDWGNAFESAAVAAVTAGLTNGITYNTSSGLGFSTGPITAGGATSSLVQLAGVQTVGGSLVPQAGATTAASLPGEALAIGADATLSAGVQTAIEGGSFLGNLESVATSEAAAAGAYEIGNIEPTLTQDLGQTGGELAYIAAHGALGCAASAAEGTGCAGGAIGGAASAAITPFILDGVDPSGAALSPGQSALVTALSMLSGAGVAGALGQNTTAAAISAENESLNNDQATPSHVKEAIGVAQSAISWLDSAGSAFASALLNTGQQAALQVFDGLYDVGGPGSLGPQSALDQSLAQNGLAGTVQAIGSNITNTIEAALQGNPTAIGSLTGSVAVGAVLGGVTGAAEAGVDSAGVEAVAGATDGGTVAGETAGAGGGAGNLTTPWPSQDVQPLLSFVQSGETTCGQTCAAAMAQSMGYTNVTEQTLNQALGTGVTNEAQLAQAVQAVTGEPMVGGAVNFDPSTLTSSQMQGVINNLTGDGSQPIMTLLNAPGQSLTSVGHWVMVDGLDAAGNVVIKDPAGLQYTMTPSNFASSWKSGALVMPSK
ncbi:adhesin [Burkholderia sp. WAC0059]|uniref:two-partner secretion domain-containing protein n=1 Tax=Burkholderia sp. WAC0059 TaxID=2066022 RepID=UPI000C7EB440|nr:filamentous hemagglutinin N-terminal domain-containing protein [Burkholderia sp. WAC0059]PLZ00439.1 adhesin [Burkholderia sp. WAC0059]